MVWTREKFKNDVEAIVLRLELLLEPRHLVHLAVDQDDVRRCQLADKVAVLLVVDVSEALNLGTTKPKVRQVTALVYAS